MYKKYSTKDHNNLINCYMLTHPFRSLFLAIMIATKFP